MQLLEALPTPLAQASQWLASSFSSEAASQSLFPFIPKPIKLAFFLVLALNARSWPGVWHFRVFRSVINYRLNELFNKRGDSHKFLTSISPIGKSVFPTADGSDSGAISVLKAWAALDDCDFNGHLSNSCYAKNLDPARMQAWVEWCPALFTDGAWVALGGAHYHYIREIPMNASYEIRMSIGGWDEKWIYLVAKFVSHPKKNSKSKSHTSKAGTTIPSITTPSTPLVAEPSTPGEPALNANEKATLLDTSHVDTRLAAKPTLRTHDDDGALIHCVAVSTYCCKHGRVTVPPKVVLAISGFSLTEVGDSSNWEHAKRLRERGPARMTEFLRGGWKTEENKFWELSPEVEVERITLRYSIVTCGWQILGADHSGFTSTTTISAFDMRAGNPTNSSVNDMTYSPPPLPEYLSRSHNLGIIVGVPTDEEVKAIHDTIRAVNSVSNFPALYDHKLSTQLAQYLFTVQMAVYRNEYPSSIFPVENTYTPPTVPSHIPIPLEPIVGAPTDGELESAHGVVRAMDNLANSPFFDSALSVKLSQHLFNIQFARYIQDSNQGHFTQKPANFPASSQQNENEPPIVTPNIPSDSVDQAVPQDAGSTGLGSTAPAPAQAAFSGNTAAPTPISQSNNDMDRLGLAHFDQRLEETNQLLKTISRTLFSTHFNVQRGYGAGGRYHSYLTMNNKGELPSVRNLPIVIPGSSSTLQGAITKQALADYLNFYDIGTDLIEEDTGDIKADRDADAQKVLAHYLWFGHPPASQGA
ncbi:unnamed protein product [Rhizoctonia solani]|uniref:Uncharacterized protein n=1 Tax=Rhizoctonia solani TaxID=456999 RepID=A0A8H3DT56_9AGAM|nr:unnamed protein product [Rhizoctonia solani]